MHPFCISFLKDVRTASSSEDNFQESSQFHPDMLWLTSIAMLNIYFLGRIIIKNSFESNNNKKHIFFVDYVSASILRKKVIQKKFVDESWNYLSESWCWMDANFHQKFIIQNLWVSEKAEKESERNEERNIIKSQKRDYFLTCCWFSSLFCILKRCCIKFNFYHRVVME